MPRLPQRLHALIAVLAVVFIAVTGAELLGAEEPCTLPAHATVRISPASRPCRRPKQKLAAVVGAFRGAGAAEQTKVAVDGASYASQHSLGAAKNGVVGAGIGTHTPTDGHTRSLLAGSTATTEITQDFDLAADSSRWLRRVLELQGEQQKDALLIYNRVRKTGSSTLEELIHHLSHRNDYAWRRVNYIYSWKPEPCELINVGKYVEWQTKPTQETVHAAIRWLQRHRKGAPRAVIDYHWFYMHWPDHVPYHPLHMNVLRDPIQRAISAYYYDRYAVRPVKLKAYTRKVYGLLNVDECIELYDKCGCKGVCKNARSCTGYTCVDLYYGLFDQYMYFCPWGHPDCRQRDTRAALELAKVTLVQHYTAFGLLERFNDTLHMLELALPTFFAGAREVAAIMPKANVNKVKDKASPATLARMREIAAYEMEFYDFAMKLFDTRVQALQNAGLWDAPPGKLQEAVAQVMAEVRPNQQQQQQEQQQQQQASQQVSMYGIATPVSADVDSSVGSGVPEAGQVPGLTGDTATEGSGAGRASVAATTTTSTTTTTTKTFATVFLDKVRGRRKRRKGGRKDVIGDILSGSGSSDDDSEPDDAMRRRRRRRQQQWQ